MRRDFPLEARCLACRSCEIACVVSHSRSKSLAGARAEASVPQPRIRVCTHGLARAVPVRCRRCAEPACVKACPLGAIEVAADSGAVRVDDSRCRGCLLCVVACPYGAISAGQQKRAVVVCDRCGELGEPACVRACPTGVLTESVVVGRRPAGEGVGGTVSGARTAR